jgi:two-component system, cell cycle sensor histidine kinase and response regulator CckA
MSDPAPVDEQMLRGILAAIPDLVFVLDRDGRIVYANRAEAGISPEEAVGRPIFDYVAPDSMEGYREDLEEAIRTGDPVEHEGQAVGADGRLRWYRNRILPVRKDGATTLIVSLARDISEQRRISRERRRSEAILEAVGAAARLFLESPDWEPQVDKVLAHLGEATEVSRAYLFETHLAPDGTPLISQRFEWAAPDTEPQIDNPEMQGMDLAGSGYARWVRLFQAGEMVQGPVADFPAAEKPHLEAQSILSMAVVPIYMDGEWWGCLGFDDCDHPRVWSPVEQEALRAAASTLGGAIKRERAEAGIRASGAHYRRLVETSPYTVWALDAEGCLTEVNRAGEELLGRSADDVLGRPFHELFAPEDLIPAQTEFHRILQGEAETVEVDLRIVRPSGEKRDIHLAARAIHSEGTLEGIHGIARDVTEERARDEQLRRAERLASLGTLIGGVAHELNNPLTAIRGLVQLLLDEERSSDEADLLRTVVREAERSARIVNNLRRLTRRSNDPPEAMGEVDLNDVVHHVLKVRRYSLQTHNIGVSLDLADPLPPVTGDLGQLEQVLLNLITNAEQALDSVDRERRIVLRTKASRQGVTLSLYDNGPGIPPEHLDHLFDPFFTTKDPDEGTGLGLSLVHTIVTGYGGQIDVQSEVGQGTLFQVHLPVSRDRAGGRGAKAPRPDGQDAAVDAAAAPPTPLRILAVDDEPSIRQFLGRLLNREGHRVVLAADGAEALRAVEAAEEPFDLILSDLRMPGVGGEEFFRALRDQAPEYEGRIVFMTGDITAREVGRIMGETRAPMVRKPFDISEILELVRSHGRRAG